jgi:hypothetical protein
MSLEGLWIARFHTAELFGSGVVVLANGKVFGGETGFYYIGTYQVDESILKARVMIRHFDKSVPSGFGIEGDYEMDVSARLEGDEFKGTAVVTNRPQYSLGIRLTKKANL